jgi:carboxylesterase
MDNNHDQHQPFGIMPGARPYFHRGGSVGVLCLHGFTASPHEVLWLGQHLAEQGHTVYAPRLAGHGTFHTDLNPMRWTHWYASAQDGYHILRQQCEQVFVCGLSMGGLLALLLSTVEAVDGAVVMAVPLRIRSAITVGRMRWYKHLRPYSDQTDRSPFAEYIRTEQERRGEPVLGRVRYGLWSSAAVEELLRLTAVVHERLDKVTVPLLLLYSEADQTVALDSLDILRSGVSSSDVQTRIFQRSGHILTQDVEHEEVFREVSQFIAEHATSS